MKTLSTLTLVAVISVSAVAPVHANPLTETLTETVSNQLIEVSSNIKLQAKQALENTIAELFFNNGSQHAAQTVQQSARSATTLVTISEQTSAQPQQ